MGCRRHKTLQILKRSATCFQNHAVLNQPISVLIIDPSSLAAASPVPSQWLLGAVVALRICPWMSLWQKLAVSSRSCCHSLSQRLWNVAARHCRLPYVVSPCCRSQMLRSFEELLGHTKQLHLFWIDCDLTRAFTCLSLCFTCLITSHTVVWFEGLPQIEHPGRPRATETQRFMMIQARPCHVPVHSAGVDSSQLGAQCS